MNAIAAAVAPLKDDAIARAEKEARALIDRVLTRLESAEWNLDVVAPKPKTSMSRAAYASARAKRDLYESLTTYTKPTRKYGEPDIRQRNAEAEARFIESAKKDAGFQYDAFVAKLVGKVGDASSADLYGNHVWGQSILTVTKPDGSIQKWKTQQIINVSKLHNLFNQWPTRLVK